MGTVDSLRNVKNIVEAETGPVVVVVSALGGITDRLILTANLACAGDSHWHEEYSYIVGRHRVIADTLVAADRQPEVWRRVQELLFQLQDVYKGIELVNDLSRRILDRVVSFGERMSSVLVTAIIDGATLQYSPDFIRTEKWYSRHIPDNGLTDTLIRERFRPLPSRVMIVPGFISSDRDTGEITNLGRGGSDFTAAILAASLDADVLEIWTDVDGFMTADPRIIPTAKVLPRLSFVESMDLCNFGAKVIYPPTIYPVFQKKIPIVIKNTFNPSAPGTFISDEHCDCDSPFRGVSSIKDVSVFSVDGVDNSSLSTRIFTMLTKNGVEVLLVSRAETDESPVVFAIREGEADRAEELIAKEYEAEIASGEISGIGRRRNAATVSVVGENLRDSEGALDRLANTLLRDHIDVMAMAVGSSGITLSVAVEGDKLNKALCLLHSAYLE